MKFIPCQSECTYEGVRCEGCGRTHMEIAETKRLVKSVVEFARQQQYENIDEFAQYFAKKIYKKLQEDAQ